jgi:acyl-CoA reductase-like NAD-dependent aldehyde dehydrogenase
VPQNASLSLSVIIIASALFAGSRVLLRTSLQTAATTALLAEAVRESSPPRGRIEIVTSTAADFLAACTGSSAVDLIHYIGSGRYTEEVLRASYAAGKVCLLDGSGNGLLYVDESFDVERAAEIIRAGATRLNGETCTSINGVLVDPTIHSRLRDAVVEAFGTLRMGDPMEAEVDVGPLFGPRHAEALEGSLRAGAPTGRLLSGGRAEGAYFRPAVVDGVERHDPIVGEGFFGPAVWIGAVAAGELEPWLRRNRYPLCDTVLSHRPEVIEAMATASPAARLCINTDPSVESMFEPWGGYPPGGLNPVSVWTDKYQQTYQVARPV